MHSLVSIFTIIHSIYKSRLVTASPTGLHLGPPRRGSPQGPLIVLKRVFDLWVCSTYTHFKAVAPNLETLADSQVIPGIWETEREREIETEKTPITPWWFNIVEEDIVSTIWHYKDKSVGIKHQNNSSFPYCYEMLPLSYTKFYMSVCLSLSLDLLCIYNDWIFTFVPLPYCFTSLHSYVPWIHSYKSLLCSF